MNGTGKAKAAHALKFISKLTHTKGEWAGQPFKILPWQKSLITQLFGTLKPDGTRQYRICYCEIPKKNGKSELGAALALYLLCADGEASPEVYSAAADREQASLVFHVAAQMVRNHPTMEKRLKVRPAYRRIYYERNGGVYRVLSSDVKTKHGLNPSGIIFDELHSQPNDELWRVLTVGTDYARKQQLIFVITTAGVWDKESIWWRVRERARQVADGIIEDRTWLPILYIADPERDDPHDEGLWKRVNPSVGRIFTMKKIREDYEQAKGDLVEWEDFKRFRLNIPSKHIHRWMPMADWDQCSGPVDLAALKDRPCYGGLDLSSTVDLSALAIVWPPEEEDGPWHCWTRGYCPSDTIIQKSHQDHVDYTHWQARGHIVATPGNVIDYGWIRKDVLEMSGQFDIREIGYDPWNATQIATDLLNNEGLRMVEVRQGAKSLSEPAKQMLKTVKAHRLRHGGNPALRWCVDNLVMVPDSNENLRPVKDKATGRIDIYVALLIAWARALANLGIGSSVYETRGIMVIG